ncbi:MAG: hypothetical protein EOO59_11120, partial [Hymenobacter sp.]
MLGEARPEQPRAGGRKLIKLRTYGALVAAVVTGLPTVSPDGRYLLSTRSDQGNDGSDESAVGTQLYELAPAGPRLLWTR